MEIWKDVKNYEEYYSVSNLGRVVSKRRNREMTYTDNKGYLRVKLSKDGTGINKEVHLLVAEVFLNHTPNRKMVVDHIDNDKSNNKLSNLQIITQRENANKDRKNYSSKYRGVHFDKSRNKWVSSIFINGSITFLGRYNCELKAAKAYNDAVPK